MNGPKRFIECLLPVTACNLKCEYCYIIQEGRRTGKIEQLDYPIETMVKALSKERLGGPCFISICGAGETLLPKYIVPIVHGLLKEGHYVNLTNNGTISERIKELCDFDPELLKHLLFSFSLHYIELKKHNLLDAFFDNCNFVHEKGCSFFVQFNLYDGYEPYLEDIKKICLERVGALPQVCATRDETDKVNNSFFTKHTIEEYKNIGDQFNSPLWEFTFQNFMQKRKEFCHAGEWSLTLNLKTGDISQCYFNNFRPFNIFENVNQHIPFFPVGHCCNHSFCINSSHFISLGVIPSYKCPSYSELRNRNNNSYSWINDDLSIFVKNKLNRQNHFYLISEICFNFAYDVRNIRNRIKKWLKK